MATQSNELERFHEMPGALKSKRATFRTKEQELEHKERINCTAIVKTITAHNVYQAQCTVPYAYYFSSNLKQPTEIGPYYYFFPHQEVKTRMLGNLF